jgi:hypothetical protein
MKRMKEEIEKEEGNVHDGILPLERTCAEKSSKKDA